MSADRRPGASSAVHFSEYAIFGREPSPMYGVTVNPCNTTGRIGAWTAITVYPERGQFRLVEFPAESHAGPFVTLHLGEGVPLQVDQPATLDALADLVASAQSWLATAGGPSAGRSL